MKKLVILTLLTLSYTIVAKNDSNCPSGSYLQSCDGCSYDEQTKKLSCNCHNSYGGENESTIQLPCLSRKPYIVNSKGTLKCSSSADLPR